MSRRVVIALIGLIVLFVVGVTATVALALVATSRAVSGPHQTFNAYYDAVKVNDWQRAHDLLSPNLGGSITPTELGEAFTQAATEDGQIVKVTIFNTQVSNDQATLVATIERERDKGEITANLLKIGEQWKIDEFLSP